MIMWHFSIFKTRINSEHENKNCHFNGAQSYHCFNTSINSCKSSSFYRVGCIILNRSCFHESPRIGHWKLLSIGDKFQKDFKVWSYKTYKIVKSGLWIWVLESGQSGSNMDVWQP
jgi:hypothetical protein